MFSFLKRRFSRFKHEYQNSNFDMELIYDNGKHRFYTYKNPIQLPLKRTEACLLYSRYAQLCVTPERLNTMLTALIQANNKGDASRVGAIANNLLFADKAFGERKSLLGLATVYCVLEGEPAEKYINSWQDKKREIWEQDEDCRDFFLLWASRKTPSLIKMQLDTILKHLQEVEEVNILFQLILEDTLQTSQKSETK